MLFRHENITIAMVARGFTQKQLAIELEVSQGGLSKFISGELSVKPEFIEKLSEVLGYPISFFYEEIRVLPRHLVYYRKRVSMSQSEMNKLHYNFYIHKHALKKMLDVVEVPYNLPSLPTEKFGTPEKIAQCVRQRWMVPRGPIKNLVNLVESAGIFILWADVENDSFDGQIIPDEGGLPVMAINKNMTADRQRFTIAHELGHLVMHYPNYIPTVDSNEDEEANRFAAEFLMPRQDVYADLYDNSSFQRLITLKPYWKVSIASLVRRALDLGIINKSRYTSLNVQLSRDGMKKREPTFGLEPEKPTLFKQLIDLHLVDLEYSHRSLAEKMLLSTTELESIIDTYSDRSLRFKILRSTA